MACLFKVYEGNTQERRASSTLKNETPENDVQIIKKETHGNGVLVLGIILKHMGTAFLFSI